MSHRPLAFALVGLAALVAACSKPPLVGSFSGTAHVKTTMTEPLPGEPKNEDVPVTVTVATDGSSGTVHYTFTVQGGPFASACVVTAMDEVDSKSESGMLVLQKRDCKVKVDGKTQDADTMGTAMITSKDEIKLDLSLDTFGMKADYAFKGKRATTTT
jgi:hypothetical protein